MRPLALAVVVAMPVAVAAALPLARPQPSMALMVVASFLLMMLPKVPFVGNHPLDR